MMQESFVFTGTVMDNLRYGNLAAGDEELIRAAELVCADGFIRALPHGYDTVLTEGGAMLSQGEKQLLALARTMASDPKILILDEATSALDNTSEKHIQGEIEADEAAMQHHGHLHRPPADHHQERHGDFGAHRQGD